jgi:aminoglycoside/choline kinase family phosphotransferase
MSALHELSMTEAADAVARGEVTATALTENCLARIAAHDGKVNSVIRLDRDSALEQAAAVDAARKAGLPVTEEFGEFWRQLEWMGLQRHLKVLGIFCRLKHRDGKPAYAEDLPRFFTYATKVALRYRELSPLLPLLEPMSGQRVGSGLTF